MLILTELTIDQSEELLSFEIENREYFEKYVPARPEDYFTLEGVQKSVTSMYEQRSVDEYYLYLLKIEGNQIVGRVNVFNINRSTQTGELGYRIGKEFTGKGFATDAVDIICNEAKNTLGLSRMKAMTIKSNSASERVLEKNGFKRIDVLHKYLLFNGEMQDASLFIKEL